MSHVVLEVQVTCVTGDTGGHMSHVVQVTLEVHVTCGTGDTGGTGHMWYR